jgi:hypothetical protein
MNSDVTSDLHRQCGIRLIYSPTAEKVGWGSARYRRVTRLSPEERAAVRRGDLVWFAFEPWHYMQSGYKIVTLNGYGYDSREPTPKELNEILSMKGA